MIFHSAHLKAVAATFSKRLSDWPVRSVGWMHALSTSIYCASSSGSAQVGIEMYVCSGLSGSYAVVRVAETIVHLLSELSHTRHGCNPTGSLQSMLLAIAKNELISLLVSGSG